MPRQTGRTARGSRWTVVVLAAIAVGWVALSIAWAQGSPELADAVLVVDGEAVDERELLLHMEGQRARIADEFRRQYGAEVDEAFWTRQFGDETPAERLRKAAGDGAARIQVERIIAWEAGALSDISFAAFMTALEKENERRASAVAAGQVVYGPTRFETVAYYSYYMSGIRNAAIEALLNAGQLPESGDEPRQAYEALVERRLLGAHMEWKR